MKKILFLLLMICSTSCALAGGEGSVSDSQTMFIAGSQLPIDLYLRGRIGGDDDCELFIDCHTNRGHYNFNGMKRSVRVASYNKKTRKLVINAYNSKGEYIGKFDGTFKYESFVAYGIERGSATYKGTFTNTKGSKVTFDLMDYWD